jgi:tetratricopeptide (TPR) repeat protein
VNRLPLLICAALCATSAWAGPKKATPKEPEKPPTAAEPVELTKKEVKVREKAFATYDSELASGSKTRAADALVAIVDDPALAEFHGEAYAKLGDILAELDLKYSALCAYEQAFETATDTNVDDVSLRVPKAIEIAHKVGDVAILQKPFAANLGLARTDDVRGEMAYLAAKETIRSGQWGTASAILKMVKEGDPLWADAEVLNGIVLNQQARHEEALRAFDTASRAGQGRDARWQDSLQLNTARTWYGAGNYPRAIEAFSRVSRSSDFWPDAQFERAWAHFRVDDFNGALGQLLPFDSAFFAKWYFPEADLLRIYSMFLLCKFPEAESQMAHFKEKYAPVHDKLKAWDSHSNAETFDAAKLYAQKGKLTELPEMIWRPWADEERFTASMAAVKSADDELKRMKSVAANPFSDRAKEWLTARRDGLVEAEGGRIKERFSAQESELGEMLANSELFILDILRMKQQMYEQSAITGKELEAAKSVKRTERIRKGYAEWPFEGEFWEDELGYYKVDVTAECPASMRQSVVK